MDGNRETRITNRWMIGDRRIVRIAMSMRKVDHLYTAALPAIDSFLLNCSQFDLYLPLVHFTSRSVAVAFDRCRKWNSGLIVRFGRIRSGKASRVRDRTHEGENLARWLEVIVLLQ